jgi:ABC-type bacteriocin/lantibiotic exporter with double-glycine peptidase domain
VSKRRLFAPEVIQASAMDCGPAALKCLLEGFFTPISYGRLREACQTDVDGTSIDTLEEIAVRLGLEAEQIMIPRDHLLLPEADALPAIVVMRMPGGGTHFVVAWRRHGPFVQIMDPAAGRRWVTASSFLEDCFEHETAVPAEAWREWAGSESFTKVLRRRLRKIGLSANSAEGLLARALADAGWKTFAALDAATRMTMAVVAAGGIRRGAEAARTLSRLVDAAISNPEIVPSHYWSVRSMPEADQVKIKGAVLITVRGRQAAAQELPAELTAALAERPPHPGWELLRLLGLDGALAPVAMLGSLAVAAGAVMLEALLFRGMFDIGRELGVSGQRLGAIAGVLIFLAALLILEFPIAAAALRLGRHLEVRLRLEFLRKMPRLGDRYFQSRLRSDMTQRSHSIFRVRRLPEMAVQLTRYSFELLLTAAGIIWLDRSALIPAALSAAAALLLPIVVQPPLQERDLRVRTHLGALSRYYLDALLGLTAIRCHGGERAVRMEHEGLLVEWARASFRLQALAATVVGLQMFVGFGLAAWLVFGHLARHGEAGGVLLLVYWALNLPALGQEIAQIAWQYPAMRNATLRLLEPLGALEEKTMPGAQRMMAAAHGMAVVLEGVTVRAAGNVILDGIDLAIEPGSHVAIVGSSGAGKSSLVGLLLGWHRASSGVVRIDGQPFDQLPLDRLRAEISWVDPSVHLWNEPFIENLCYGSPNGVRQRAGSVLEAADLVRVLQKLPDGLQTPLGESGSMVSGGEGQRVRLGRALLRPGIRLVILDEPFRGLEREQRRDLLARARELWRGATLLCITHDIGETLGFSRVLVVENGHIVEDGSPVELAASPDTQYRKLLEAEDAVLEGLWADPEWRRLVLTQGVLVENNGEQA